MNLQFVSNRTGRVRHLDLADPQTLFAVSGAVVLMAAAVFGLGLVIGRFVLAGSLSSLNVAQVLEQQRSDILAARSQLDGQVDAIAARVGSLNAELIRLDALGRRLTRLAGLDRGEFDFDKPPPAGGPQIGDNGGGSAQVPELGRVLDGLQQQLEDRERQLLVLESLLATRKLGPGVLPGGMPLIGGWVSSPFGY
ncbi:MAG TPA: hypothetical protein VMT50_00395, partial [Steroidobacteraceae bacterium]|nr:hypothetical protein [Steroidobacteraceae bacterium]